MTFSYNAPNGGMPALEVPGAFREMAENSLTQARQTYQQFKATAESANGAIEASCSRAAEGATAYQAKLLEIARDNTTAAFDFYGKMLGVKSVTDLTDLMTSHARAQTEALTAQSRELAELGQKMATETMEPFKDLGNTASKAFQQSVHENVERTTDAFDTAADKAREAMN